jgi:hypothetical protein
MSRHLMQTAERLDVASLPKRRACAALKVFAPLAGLDRTIPSSAPMAAPTAYEPTSAADAGADLLLPLDPRPPQTQP